MSSPGAANYSHYRPECNGNLPLRDPNRLPKTGGGDPHFLFRPLTQAGMWQGGQRGRRKTPWVLQGRRCRRRRDSEAWKGPGQHLPDDFFRLGASWSSWSGCGGGRLSCRDGLCGWQGVLGGLSGGRQNFGSAGGEYGILYWLEWGLAAPAHCTRSPPVLSRSRTRGQEACACAAVVPPRAHLFPQCTLI